MFISYSWHDPKTFVLSVQELITFIQSMAAAALNVPYFILSSSSVIMCHDKESVCLSDVSSWSSGSILLTIFIHATVFEHPVKFLCLPLLPLICPVPRCSPVSLFSLHHQRTLSLFLINAWCSASAFISQFQAIVGFITRHLFLTIS